MTIAIIFALWLGFDLKGIVGGNVSEPESLLHKLGIKSVGRFFTADPAKTGTVRYDRQACINCFTCLEVCPKGVFTALPSDHCVKFENPENCFNCGACIKQCPSGALFIYKDSDR